MFIFILTLSGPHSTHPSPNFWFLVNSAVGTQMKRAGKISQTGPDQNEKHIQGRGVPEWH